MIGQNVAYELNCLDVTQCRMAIMERWVCLSLDVGVGQQCLFGLEVCESCSLVSGTAHTVCPVEFQSSGLRTDSSGFRFGICFSKFNCCFVGFVGFFCWIHVCLAPEPD